MNSNTHAGVIETRPKPDGSGHLYQLTEAGADLSEVIYALAAWGERWIEVTTERSDPGFALWAWCQVQLDRSAQPAGRVVVTFTFPDERPGNRRYWLLIEHGDAEVCYSDPGGEPDLMVEARSLPFVDWHRGCRTWRDVLRSGDVKLTGPTWLRRSFPTWNRHMPVVAAWNGAHLPSLSRVATSMRTNTSSPIFAVRIRESVGF